MKKYLLRIVLLSSLFLITGCKKSIVGKWKSIDNDNEYYYIFNNDKTCSYEMTVARLDCTYEEDGKRLTILYKGSPKKYNFTYSFDGKTLIIKDSSNKDHKFIKEK